MSQRVRAAAIVVLLALGAGRAHGERQAGFQVGGSGFFQGVARFRILPSVALELGGMALTHVLTASGGVEVEPYRRGRLGLYASGGVAAAGVFGPVQADPACDPSVAECEYVPGGAVLAFGYARVGARWRFAGGTRAVSLDVGAWLGTGEDQQAARVERGRFVTPVGGLSYLWLWP